MCVCSTFYSCVCVMIHSQLCQVVISIVGSLCVLIHYCMLRPLPPSRQAKPGKIHCLLLTLSSLIFMLPWQFAQFVLLTQQLSLLAVYSITLIGPTHFLCVTTSLCLALAANIVLQFGNTLLLTSFLPPCLMVCLVSGETVEVSQCMANLFLHR